MDVGVHRYIGQCLWWLIYQQNVYQWRFIQASKHRLRDLNLHFKLGTIINRVRKRLPPITHHYGCCCWCRRRRCRRRRRHCCCRRRRRRGCRYYCYRRRISSPSQTPLVLFFEDWIFMAPDRQLTIDQGNYDYTEMFWIKEEKKQERSDSHMARLMRTLKCSAVKWSARSESGWC